MYYFFLINVKMAVIFFEIFNFSFMTFLKG